jgi:hypothetical protein
MYDAKRDEQMLQWVGAGPEAETPEHADVVMWGVWFDVNGDEYKPPTAMFGDEDDANNYAEKSGEKEWCVSPCVVSLKTRDNYAIPLRERTPTESSSP